MSRPGSVGNVQSLDSSFIDFEEFTVENAGSGTVVQENGKVGSESVGRQTAEDVERQLVDGEIGGADLLRGAEVDGASSAAKQLAKTATRRSTGGAMLSALGRFLMGVAHAVKSFFTLDILRPSWYANNVTHFDLELKDRHERGLVNADPLPDDDGTPAIAFDRELVVAATGFGGKINSETGKVSANITVKPFRRPLYPHDDHPRLRDIIQHPSLQDCWFLAGIAAMLSTKGPESIERLIRPNEDGTYDVRLGKKHFTVPAGELQCNRRGCVSRSAPWVQILEQAAAMYMATVAKSDMIFGNASTALMLLSGGGAIQTPVTEYVTVELLARAVENRVPVEIGHVGNGVGSVQYLAGALRDNISPGHAVTLLNVQRRGHGKAWLTVMDPYGRTRIISSSAMKRCTFVFGCDRPTLTQLKGEEDEVDGKGELPTASSGKRADVEAELGDGDDDW